jgi:cell division septation protein DedD
VNMSFKWGLKSIIYALMGVWMFVLGVMVGRGTAPVTFETRGFQERLRDIVSEYGKTQISGDPDGKMALHYYDALNDPMTPEEMVMPMAVKDLDEKMPEPGPLAGASSAGSVPDSGLGGDSQTGEASVPETRENGEALVVPVKISQKTATLRKNAAPKQDMTETRKSEKPPPPETDQRSGADGAYTIQVAAFQSFKDAVTQMAILDEKGFAANRTSKRIDGITWYRVRVGAFVTRDAAARYLETLNQAGINGMIIKKD